ncbi:condensin-2 complex subunit H2-like [Mizuhopecten yessoensis]|uniref:Condensin-2 complex subunit H2 n=1 Tax=Mizuhopecten yessoensis TaxID=6573 RepID=A0A210Q4P8_MIZYE|nr:condensin-2 complex subunit H2-like [Mizuhopecten yessoensis]OWF43720.1 Condensin-2 complex subunit H2 [Mizuhopecten yessoensis]
MVVQQSQTQNIDAMAKFCSMLQPIRDLTKNWDVDIAGNLEDYLEELEHITVAFDRGLVTMNFAEAAMVIQGSACVYSKKVEYLYTLVHQVLDLLANKKKQAKASSVDDEGHDEDAHFNDGTDEFLSLDDIQEHTNIWIKEDSYGCKVVQPMPQMPLCLIPLEDGEKGDNPLLSKTGEVLGSRNDFRMNTSSVHQSGILLLDMYHYTLIDRSINMATSSLQGQGHSPVTPHETDVAEEPPMAEDVPMDDPSGDDNNEHMFDVPNDEVDGAPPKSDVPPVQTETLKAESEELRRSERRAKTVRIVPPKPKVDHWDLLDQHEALAQTEKAFKKSKTFKIPECVQDVTKKRKRKTQMKKPKLQPLSDFITGAFSHKSKFPKNPRKVPVFIEFEQQYWIEYKRRQSILREQRKSLSREVLEEDQEDEDVNQNDEPDNIDMGVDKLDDGDDLDDDAPLVDDNLFNAIESAFSLQPVDTASPSRSEHCGFPVGDIVTDYEELVRQHVEQYMASAQEYAQITELSQRVAEWEDKVIPKLEEEDSHEPFDINKYGTKVLNNLSKDTVVPFKCVATGKPPFEICRLFLSSLMLANTENVKIVQKGYLEEGIDMFEMRLLSTTRMFEQLEEYQAPSLAAS